VRNDKKPNQNATELWGSRSHSQENNQNGTPVHCPFGRAKLVKKRSQAGDVSLRAQTQKRRLKRRKINGYPTPGDESSDSARDKAPRAKRREFEKFEQVEAFSGQSVQGNTKKRS